MKIGIGRDITVDFDLSKIGLVEDELSPVAVHMLQIGGRNILMDAHASAKKEYCESNKLLAEGQSAKDVTLTPEQELAVKAIAESMALKKRDAMYSGEIRVAGERSRKSVLEKIALAKAELYVAMRPEWRGLKAKDRTEKAKAFLLNEKSIFWKQAQDEIDAQAELGDIDL
jgi:hypothetical protein